MNTALSSAQQVHFTNGLAAVVVFLALYGLIALFGLVNEDSFLRLVFMVIIIGTLFVNIPVIAEIGKGLRDMLVSLLEVVKLSELASNAVLVIIFLLLLVFFYRRHTDPKHNNQNWLLAIVADIFVLMTVSSVATGVIWLSNNAAHLFTHLPQVNF